MVKIEENKILSVVVNSEFELQVSDTDHQCLNIFFVANGEPKHFDTWFSSEDITTIEELKVFASWWYEKNVGESRVVGEVKRKIPTLDQLDLYSEAAMRVEIGGFQFIIGDEIPVLQIIANGEVVTDYIVVGDEDKIHDIAALERYAIKWYYKNELGMDF